MQSTFGRTLVASLTTHYSVTTLERTQIPKSCQYTSATCTTLGSILVTTFIGIMILMQRLLYHLLLHLMLLPRPPPLTPTITPESPLPLSPHPPFSDAYSTYIPAHTTPMPS
jgi:hypothetical protein